jgi:hypothetical protein
MFHLWVAMQTKEVRRARDSTAQISGRKNQLISMRAFFSAQADALRQLCVDSTHIESTRSTQGVIAGA